MKNYKKLLKKITNNYKQSFPIFSMILKKKNDFELFKELKKKWKILEKLCLM